MARHAGRRKPLVPQLPRWRRDRPRISRFHCSRRRRRDSGADSRLLRWHQHHESRFEERRQSARGLALARARRDRTGSGNRLHVSFCCSRPCLWRRARVLRRVLSLYRRQRSRAGKPPCASEISDHLDDTPRGCGDLPGSHFHWLTPDPDADMLEVILKRFEEPDEVREMVKGRFEIVRIGGLTIGRATYEPCWKWSEHVGPSLG